jgi:hypothetical protein
MINPGIYDVGRPVTFQKVWKIFTKISCSNIVTKELVHHLVPPPPPPSVLEKWVLGLSVQLVSIMLNSRKESCGVETVCHVDICHIKRDSREILLMRHSE